MKQDDHKPFIAIPRKFFEELSINKSKYLYLYCWLSCNAARGEIKNYATKYGRKTWYAILKKNRIFVTRKILSELLGCHLQTARKMLNFLKDYDLINVWHSTWCSKRTNKKQIIDIEIEIKRPTGKEKFIKIYEEDFKKFDPKTQLKIFYVYCWLVKNQRYEEKPIKRKHGRSWVELSLKPGQLIVGRYLTSKSLGIKPEAFRRYLDTLEKMGLIKKKGVKGFYTIVQIQATREGEPEIVYVPSKSSKPETEQVKEQTEEQTEQKQEEIKEFMNKQTEEPTQEQTEVPTQGQIEQTEKQVEEQTKEQTEEQTKIKNDSYVQELVDKIITEIDWAGNSFAFGIRRYKLDKKIYQLLNDKGRKKTKKIVDILLNDTDFLRNVDHEHQLITKLTEIEKEQTEEQTEINIESYAKELVENIIDEVFFVIEDDDIDDKLTDNCNKLLKKITQLLNDRGCEETETLVNTLTNDRNFLGKVRNEEQLIAKLTEIEKEQTEQIEEFEMSER